MRHLAFFMLCLLSLSRVARAQNIVADTLRVGNDTPTARMHFFGKMPWEWPGVVVHIDNHDTSGFAGVRINSRAEAAPRGGALYHVGSGAAARLGAFAPNSTVLLGYEPSGVALLASNAAGSLRFYAGTDEPAGERLRITKDNTLFFAGDGQSAPERMRITKDGKIGIGTSAPYHSMDVHAKSDLNLFPATPITMAVYDTNAYSAPGVGAGIAFGGYYNPAEVTTWAVISGIRENTIYGNYAGALTFGTRPQGNVGEAIEQMRLTSAGELIIGPSTGAGQRLTVNGDAIVNGNIGAKYQDVAEWVPAVSDLAPGTVVVLNPHASNEVMPSGKPYDTAVAGVVSAQPGLILGIEAAGKEQIATTGRVKVKVDATQYAIEVGDLLVTGTKPGTAMRSMPIDVGRVKIHRPGTIIGKALEPLNAGEGEILVLLSMQ